MGGFENPLWLRWRLSPGGGKVFRQKVLPTDTLLNLPMASVPSELLPDSGPQVVRASHAPPLNVLCYSLAAPRLPPSLLLSTAAFVFLLQKEHMLVRSQPPLLGSTGRRGSSTPCPRTPEPGLPQGFGLPLVLPESCGESGAAHLLPTAAEPTQLGEKAKGSRPCRLGPLFRI